MKIGILTYHYGYNYGGVLQCYALQQSLCKLGYDDVHVINCIPSKLKFYLGGLPRRREVRVIYDWYIRLRYGKNCKSAFDLFRSKWLNQTINISRAQLPYYVKDYDALIVGSDQIWNYREQSDGMFFLNWEPQFTGLKIAYAPCCGYNEINDAFRSEIIKALRGFSSLSVRNGETASFVENLLGVRPQIVPDPTCLYDFSDLNNTKRLVKENYVFVYILGNEISGGNSGAIGAIKRKFVGSKVIASVIAYSNPQQCQWADEIKYDLSPEDWINMIKYADFVFTDSFHGTIFSMRYNVPFLTFCSEERRKSRFIELIKQFGIEKNIVHSVEEIESYSVTLQNFDDKFKAISHIGENYLMDALNICK